MNQGPGKRRGPALLPGPFQILSSGITAAAAVAIPISVPTGAARTPGPTSAAGSTSPAGSTSASGPARTTGAARATSAADAAIAGDIRDSRCVDAGDLR